MAVPTFQEIMYPLLQFASDGQEHNMNEAVGAVADLLNLTYQERTQLYPSPSTVKKPMFAHRLAWARTHLKQAGLLEDPHRSHFKITERGLSVLGENPPTITTKYLERFPEYVDFEKRVRQKTAVHAGDAALEPTSTTPEIVKESSAVFLVNKNSRATKAKSADSRKLRSTMSFADAAEKVLKQFANDQPMHYQEITQKALELGLLTTSGQTPQQTMYAQIGTDIERSLRRGEVPRFTKHGRGMVSLAQTQRLEVALARQIDQHNAKTRKLLHERLYSMDPTEFEGLVGRLLAKIGFEQIEVTSRSRDGGIDVRGTLVVASVIRINMAVQVKRWRNNIQTPTVREVRGSLGTHDQGLIITTGGFSSGALDEATRSDAVPVALMNGEQLVALLVENDIGVVRTPYNLIELDEVEEE